MSASRLTTRDFDPFEFDSLFRYFRGVRPAWFWLFSLPVAALIVSCAAIDGTLGKASDFQSRNDLLRIIGRDTGVQSRPYFPLARDPVSWFLAFTVVAGLVLLRWQWRTMSTCLSRLAEYGAIGPRQQTRLNFVSRLLGINRVVRGAQPSDALDRVIERVNSFMQRLMRGLAIPIAALSLLIGYLLVLGEKHQLFEVLMPDNLRGVERQQWLRAAYENWWASDRHIAGHILYLFMATLGVYIIVTFTIIGFAAVYVAIAMYFVTSPSADWFNRDGQFGWTPIARVFRTVYWALVVQGSNLSVILVILGVRNFPWVMGLVAMWVVVVPVYILIPWITFRRVETVAKQERIAAIDDEIRRHEGTSGYSIEVSARLATEVDRCRSARIRPMRLRTPVLSSFIVVVALPIALTIAQVLFELRFGAK